MPKYLVTMTTMAYMTGSVIVEAKTRTKAERLALDLAEDGVDWSDFSLCEGPDQGPEISTVERIKATK